MSRVDELLAELCPDGVENRPLSTIGTWYGGGTPSKSRPEFWKGGSIPWVSPKDMGQMVVDRTQDHITEAAVEASATRVVPPVSVVMVVRSSILDRVFPTALVPVPVALNQDMKAVVPEESIVPEFLAHMLRSRGDQILRAARKSGGSVASIETRDLLAFRIPVPPLEAQREIVRILDTFTELEAELETELETELEARRRQYEHYRNGLFSHASGARMPAGELGTFVRGRRFTKADVVESGIPSIHYGEIYTHYGASAITAASHVRREIANRLAFALPGDVVLAAVGETVEDVGKAVAWLGDQPIAIHDDTFRFRSDLDPKFVSYFTQTSDFHSQKNQHVARAKVKRLSASGLAKIQIPVPPLDEQQRIVAALDSFDALVNDLSVGLPAELAARRKQYEYYRDTLLTFKEASA